MGGGFAGPVWASGAPVARHGVSKRRFSARVLAGSHARQAVAVEKVDLAQKLALIEEHWRPKVVAELNGQEVKLVKFQGEFVWHRHEHEDELFLGVRGRFRVEFRDRSVELGP